MERKRVSFSACGGLCQNLPLFTFWMNVSIAYKKKGHRADCCEHSPLNPWLPLGRGDPLSTPSSGTHVPATYGDSVPTSPRPAFQRPHFLTALYPEPTCAWVSNTSSWAACVTKKPKMNYVKHPSPIKTSASSYMYGRNLCRRILACLAQASLKRLQMQFKPVLIPFFVCGAEARGFSTRQV